MSHPLFTKSKKSWETAEKLWDEGEVNGAANRYYYSVFQAIKADMVQVGEMTVDEQHEVHGKAGRFLKGQNRTLWEVFDDLRELRATADYLPDPVDASVLEELRAGAKKLLGEFHRREK